MVEDLVASLLAEAAAANERRVLVCAGGRETTYDDATRAIRAVDGDRTVVSDARLDVPAEHLDVRRSGDLLGRTRDAILLDAHDAFPPNALGRAVGAVDGGGLLVLAVPPLSDWPDRRDGFDEGLAVPPFDPPDVTGRFRRRFVATVRAHPGVAVYDADAETVTKDGLTDPAPRVDAGSPTVPDDRTFPVAAYEACLTADQATALRTLERLRDPGSAVVVESDRGRGKSSAAGLAAGSLAAEGRDVLVTAPRYRSAAEVFARAEELLDVLGVLADTADRSLAAAGGGRVRYLSPPDAVDADADALVVDEAAALPVRLLESLAAGDRPIAFTTTVHGYEGAGRGFSVRFRGHLDESNRDVTDATMSDPIRYAAGDPAEAWAFRALMLDASPPVEQLVDGARPGNVEYARLDPGELFADEHLLRGAFGLLVHAHYRTEPDDLARLLDAPNLTLRALLFEDRVVAVALLAWEGDLPEDTREAIYEGSRIRGNMLPDVLSSQLRDLEAGASSGLRVMRIATHPAVRSRGLGSKLLGRVRAEFADDGAPAVPGDHPPDPVGRRASDRGLDYLGVGYGATPELLRFWRRNGYGTVHLSTSRNDTSGEYSALMLDPLTDDGRKLRDRNAAWFLRRIPSVLADALDDCDPAVVRETLAAADGEVSLDLSDREWRTVAAAAFGPGLYDAAPRPFRRLALRALVRDEVDPETGRLLVAKALQARDWDDVADDLGYVSRRAASKALGDAFRPLVDGYGTDAAREEADRYR